MLIKSQKKFSILGCGWLGLPLAEFLLKNDFLINGTTTNTDKLAVLKEKDINPFLIKISENTIFGEIDSFLNSDILFVNIPYTQQKENFLGYEKLVSAIEKSTVKKVLFISSTSVYADTNSVVDEDENFTYNPSRQTLLDLENLFLKNAHFKTTIIRFAGLVGGSRNPGNFFKADRIVSNGLAPINLIHLDDCLKIVLSIVKNNCWNTILNASADTHPTRKEFYTAASIHAKNTAATFLENTDFDYKIISNKKLKETLNYSFVHGDLLKMISVF